MIDVHCGGEPIQDSFPGILRCTNQVVDDVEKVGTEHLLHHAKGPLGVQDIRLIPGFRAREILHGNVGLKRRQSKPWSQKRAFLKRRRVASRIEERRLRDGRCNG